MSVPEAPKGMTYFEIIADRLDAAKTVKPVMWVGNDVVVGNDWTDLFCGLYRNSNSSKWTDSTHDCTRFKYSKGGCRRSVV